MLLREPSSETAVRSSSRLPSSISHSLAHCLSCPVKRWLPSTRPCRAVLSLSLTCCSLPHSWHLGRGQLCPTMPLLPPTHWRNHTTSHGHTHASMNGGQCHGDTALGSGRTSHRREMLLWPLEARGGWVGGFRPWVESMPSSVAQGLPALPLREDPAGPLTLCCLSLIQSCPDPGCHV